MIAGPLAYVAASSDVVEPSPRCRLSYLETLLVILRRWRFSVPAMLLAVGIGSMAFWVVPPAYEDSTQVLFLGSPKQPGEPDLINPYLQLASTLVSTADVIRLKVTTAQTAQELAANGFRAQYEVTLDQSTPAPVLIVITKDSDPNRARLTGRAVVDEIERLLEDVQRQAGAPRSTWVSSTVISRLPEPQRKLNESLRPAIGAFVVVLAIALFGLFLFEGRREPSSSSLRQRQRQRQRQKQKPTPQQHQQPATRHEPPAVLPPSEPIWVNGLTPRRPPLSPAARQVTRPSEPESRPIWQP